MKKSFFYVKVLFFVFLVLFNFNVYNIKILKAEEVVIQDESQINENVNVDQDEESESDGNLVGDESYVNQDGENLDEGSTEESESNLEYNEDSDQNNNTNGDEQYQESENDEIQNDNEGDEGEEQPIVLNHDILIRNNDNILFEGEVSFSEEGELTILDSNGIEHLVNKRSVLGLIYSLSQREGSLFQISNLQYYSSFDSFYLKCITSNGEDFCDNWQFVVNGQTPYVGIDKVILTGNEDIIFYFGTPHRVNLTSNSFSVNSQIDVVAQKYDYTNNTWNSLNNVTISVGVKNEQELWNPTILKEIQVSNEGEANFELDTVGEYILGIKEDFLYPSYTIFVTENNEDTTEDVSNNSSGSTSGGVSQDVYNFSLEKLISFISTNQKADGSFGGSMYTDWMALGISQNSNLNLVSNNLKSYYRSNIPDFSSLTDRERYILALLSLNINPYTHNNIDYVKPIVDSFDGQQIGDRTLFNDDIFALIILSHLGFDSSDEIIRETVSSLILKQGVDGSFGSIDMSAAALEALYNFKDINGVNNSINKIYEYLLSKQESDGNFGNIFSTSWVVSSLSNKSFSSNVTSKGVEYLKKNQKEDGSLIDGSTQNKIWLSSYVLPALNFYSWNDLLSHFSNPYDIEDTQNTQENVLDVDESPKIQILEEKKDEEKNIEVLKEKDKEKKVLKQVRKISIENKPKDIENLKEVQSKFVRELKVDHIKSKFILNNLFSNINKKIGLIFNIFTFLV
jgi:hypothetical protein